MLKILNIGPLDGGQGDTAPVFGGKVNHMMTELYSREGVNPGTNELPTARPISSGGTGATTVEQAKINLGLAVIRLPAGTDLNNVQTPGTYYCDANVDVAAMLNIPVGMAFSLKVDVTAGVIQEFTSYAQAGTRKFIRGLYASWSPWQEVVKGANAAESRANLGLGSAATRNVGEGPVDVMQVGAFGLGSVARLRAQDPYTYFDASVLLPTQMTAFDNNDVVGYGQGLSWSVLNRLHAVIGSLLGPHLYHVSVTDVQQPVGSRQITYALIRTSANTTVDSNGFLKAASPVGELYSNRFVQNDEAKLQNIEFEQLGIGDYLLKGSTGLSQEGWYIEQPKDSNGNIFHAVEYGTHDNGDIWIKTYEQIMEGTRIVADHTRPVDIKEGRFISVRLNALPEDMAAPQNPTIADNEGNPAPSRLHELEEDVWVISEENAAILEQERLEAMQPLKRRQFRLTLVMNGYDLAEIESLINQIEDPMQRTIAKIEWQDATDFQRTNPTLLMMAELLQLTSEQIDQLWQYGLNL